MANKLSVLMITKNAEDLLDKSLESIRNLADEIIIVDANSKDNTQKIARKYNAKIFTTSINNLGKQRLFGLMKIKNEWVLSLDSDEIVSTYLEKEILRVINSPDIDENGFNIPYLNHYLNKPLQYGGENYKIMRLFKKSKVSIEPALVHESFYVKGLVGILNQKIYHYSYRSIFQIYKKFTIYAVNGAIQKAQLGERSNLKKIFLYPPHMFWARFIKDKGYKDGFFRMPLDLGFAYMEFLMYLSLLFIKQKK